MGALRPSARWIYWGASILALSMFCCRGALWGILTIVLTRKEWVLLLLCCCRIPVSLQPVATTHRPMRPHRLRFRSRRSIPLWRWGAAALMAMAASSAPRAICLCSDRPQRARRRRRGSSLYITTAKRLLTPPRTLRRPSVSTAMARRVMEEGANEHAAKRPPLGLPFGTKLFTLSATVTCECFSTVS